MAAVLWALAALAPLTPTARPAAASARTAEGARPRGGGTDDEPSIRLVEQSGVVDPDGDFVAFVEVSDVAAGSDLAVDIYPAITTRAQLDAAREGNPRGSIGTFPVIDLPGDPVQSPVQSGFVINLWGGGGPARPGGWSKRLTRAGVHPVKIRLRDPDNTTVATIVTYLQRGPDDDDDIPEPTPAAVVAEVRSDTPASDLLNDPTAPLGDDVLDGITALSTVAADHPTVALSLAVTPEVATRLTDDDTTDTDDRGPTTTGSTPTTTAPSASSSASSTSTTEGTDQTQGEAAVALASLVELLAPEHRELLGAPAQQVDPAELTALGLDDELRAQHHDGFRILTEALEAPVATPWLIDTRLDANTIDALAALEVDTVLVPPGAVDGDPPILPARVADASATTSVLVTDPTLTVGDHRDPTLAAHQLVGHLAALTALDDPGTHVIGVALPRTDDDTTELATVLGLLTDNPFVRPHTTSDLVGAAASASDRITLTAPAAPSDRAWAGDLRRTRALTASYASMVPDQPALARALADRLSRTTDHRLNSATRTTEVAAVRGEVEERFAAVSIPASDRVTLGARDAQFPLVLTSTADSPVHVIVELSASDRLTIDEPRIEVVLDGEHTEVPVAVRSRLPGDTPLRIRVTSPDGAVLLGEGTYSVRSTAVSGVGLVLTVGAGLFLAIWWGRHIVRSRRHRGRHAR